jgi:hypothetical protein
MQRLERKDDPIFGTQKLVHAWLAAIVAHPFSYLAHRATFTWQFLARSNLVWPIWDWEKPDGRYGHSPYFLPLLRLHEVLQPTVLFRAGLWGLLAVAVGAFWWPRRHVPAGAFAVAVTSCAVLYLLSFAILGVAADFRYGYWCALATLAGAVAAVIGRSQAARQA